MKNRRTPVVLLILFLFASTPASAEVLLVDSIQTAPNIQTPHNGVTMSQVRQQFGNPVSEHPAVGDPPISRWDYNDFSVFFENDLTLHSVIHRASTK